MKKIILFLAVVCFSATIAKAQEIKKFTTYEAGKNAIGLRLGGNAELSYQKFVSTYNRVELDLGWNFDGDSVGLTGIYQWVRPFSVEDIGFNWYVGAGANVGFASSEFILGVVGQLGIEYNFNIPLAISLDWRPNFGLIPATHFYANSIALGVRYRF